MIGLLFFLFVFLLAWVYFTFSKAMYRHLKDQSSMRARFWLGFTIALPSWFFFGYMLSGNYREYLAGCETDAGPHVVKPVPTNIPYSDDCYTAKRLLPNSGYEAFECKEKRQILRFTFIGTGMPQCSEPLRPREYGEDCFEREAMDTVVTPHRFVYGQDVTLKGSWISLGDLKISDVNVVLSDGTLVAYQRRYSYFPQGASATWLGLWTGEAPVKNCKHDRGFLEFADMFPPLS